MLIKLNLSGHQNAALAEMGFDFPGNLHVDLSDPKLAEKLTAFLTPLMGSGDTVHLAAPGLAPLAVLTITIIHGLTGHFPVLVPLVRGKEGFVPAEPIRLEDIRNDVARVTREDTIVL